MELLVVRGVVVLNCKIGGHSLISRRKIINRVIVGIASQNFKAIISIYKVLRVTAYPSALKHFKQVSSRRTS